MKITYETSIVAAGALLALRICPVFCNGPGQAALAR